ncbi:SDR family NAD(P)-dependent oxidoreductase [Actinomycetota bacterium]
MSPSLDAIPARSAGPRRVLITGAASGLGLALTREFVNAGDTVLATDRHEEAPTGTLPGRAAYRRLDVTRDEDWAAAREWVEEQWGGLDVIVNNAGIATGGHFDLTTMEEWDRVIDINLKGVVRGCLTFTPMMKAQRRGHIVNTASAAGLVHPPQMSSYNTVKAGVVALSETLSHELAPYGITVSAICPSFFRTNLADSLDSRDEGAKLQAREMIEGSPRSAELVASRVMRGIERRRPIILTDAEARMAWLAKRLARPVYHKALDLAAARAEKRERELLAETAVAGQGVA